MYRIGAQAVAVARYLVGALLLGAVALNFVNVVARYVFLKPIIWAEEVMQYDAIWMVMLGAAIVTWQRAHLRMEVFYDLSPAWARRAISALIDVATALVCAFVIYQGLQMMGSLQRNNQHSVVAHIPLAAMYLAIPVGFALTLLVLAVRLWERLRGRGSAAETAPGGRA